MQRRTFVQAAGLQVLAASTLPPSLLAHDLPIEEIDPDPSQAADLVDLFHRHMQLCELSEGENFVFFSRPGFERPQYVEASLAAAKMLGANAYSLVATTPSEGSGAVDASRQEGGDLLRDVFVGADLVYGQIPLYTDAHNAALASGTRTLMVQQEESTLRRMFPNEDVIRRTYAGARRMAAANEIRVTDDQGSDFTLRKDGRKGHAQVGISDKPGRWDHWPSGLVACGPLEDQSEGIYVVNPGDIILGIQTRCTSPVRITLEGGRLTSIEGGTDAAMIRQRLELFQDYRHPEGNLADPFRIAHAGWGTEHRGQWQVMGMDSESLIGNVMVSLGRNMFDSGDEFAGLGGQNYTPVHIDICCRNKNMYLDGELVIENERLIPGLA